MKASSIQICLETKRHHCVTNGFLKEFKTHVIIPCTKLFGRVSQILDSDYKKNLKMPKGVIRIRISKNRQHNGQKTEEQTTQWPKDRRTDNTVAKRQKNRQHSGQKTEEQTTQWPKEKAQKDKQRSTKHTYKTKDRVVRTH